jgi:hypothetical protein
METSHFLDEVRSINEFDKNHIKTVLPQTNEHCNKINISTVLPDTVHYKDAPVYKIKVTIDAEDTSSFDNIANELFNYINNSNFYKKSLEEKKDRLEKEVEAISSAINTIKTVIEKAELSEVNEKTITEITNSSEKLISFKNIKLLLKQSLNNFNGTEVIGKMVYSEPIAPKSKSNISLAAFIGLLAGVFSAFFIEAASKVKNSNG